MSRLPAAIGGLKIAFGVYVSGRDPDDPEHIERVGVRATMASAQRYAATLVNGRIYGYFAKGESFGHPILEATVGGTKVRFKRDWYPA